MRLPTYVYSLIYPAFLGSFLYGSLTAPFPDALHVWAALLMLLYFGAQYGEGAIAAFPGADGVPRYGAPEAAVDLAETLAMTAIMAALGVYLVAFIFKPALGRGTVHEALWGTPGED